MSSYQVEIKNFVKGDLKKLKKSNLTEQLLKKIGRAHV